MNGVYDLTLRASDGRERRMLAWLPTEAVRQDFCEKARRNGIEIVKVNFWSSESHQARLDGRVVTKVSKAKS